MAYGTNAHPPYKDQGPLIAALPPHLVPSSSYFDNTPVSSSEQQKSRTKRLVIVGDVHGRLLALKTLLTKVGFDHRNGDHLILAGDLITKGPNSAGVVQLAMDVGASAVRGNHEDKVLAIASEKERHKKQRKKKGKKGGHKKKQKKQDAATWSDESEEASEEDELSVSSDDDDGNNNNDDDDRATKSGNGDHKSVLRSLTKSQLAWVASLPVILRVGNLSSSTPFSADGSIATAPTKKPIHPPKAPWDAGEVVVVHAGLVPNVPLEKQDAWACMNMRSLLYPAAEEGKKKKTKGKNGKKSKKDKESSVEDDEEEDTEQQLSDLNVNNDQEGTLEKHKGKKGGKGGNETDDGNSDGDAVVAVPSDTREGEPWSRAWNRVQNSIADHSDRMVVVYGHDARSGLQAEPVNVRIWQGPGIAAESDAFEVLSGSSGDEHEKENNEEAQGEEEEEGANEDEEEEEEEEEEEVDEDGQKNGKIEARRRRKKHGKSHRGKRRRKGIRYAFGLDSGCGHGRQLSALVIEALPPSTGEISASGSIRHEVVQVDCSA